MTTSPITSLVKELHVMLRHPYVLTFAVIVALMAALAVIFLPHTNYQLAASAQPSTSLHYAANGNFDTGSYATGPGSLGFTVADVSNKSELDSLPTGDTGLAWIGLCGGATSSFDSAVNAYAGDGKLFGFYVMDEPDPASCPAANLKAETSYIHTHFLGIKTFIILQNLSADSTPSYANSYTPANSGMDLVGLDPYPCRSDASPAPCDYSEISKSVVAAEAVGWPLSTLVPVYQAFGGYSGGTWTLPTASQETTILSEWGAVVPTPVFDYAYSWGVQSGDVALSDAPATLQAVFSAHNGTTPPPATTTTSPTTTNPPTTTTTPITTTTKPTTTTPITTTTSSGPAGHMTCPVVASPNSGQSVTCTFGP